VESGRPVMFGTLSSRQGKSPNPWTYQLDYLDECAAAGARMWGQATTRSINALFTLKSYLSFDVLPTWRQVRSLPLPEQKRRLADPATRQPRHAWTNGFVERLQGTILQELWRVAFRRRYFTSRAALERALDGFMRHYNTERPHQGYRVRGRTPAALVWGVAAAQ
jgi:hypothetical protein